MRSRMHDRIENFAKHSAPAKNAGFHGADGDLENFGDSFVREAFEIAQNHGAAENRRNLIESMADARLHFGGLQLLEGRRIGAGKIERRIAAFFFHVDRNLLAVMTPAPAAVIESLANGDAIEPGLQR